MAKQGQPQMQRRTALDLARADQRLSYQLGFDDGARRTMDTWRGELLPALREAHHADMLIIQAIAELRRTACEYQMYQRPYYFALLKAQAGALAAAALRYRTAHERLTHDRDSALVTFVSDAQDAIRAVLVLEPAGGAPEPSALVAAMRDLAAVFEEHVNAQFTAALLTDPEVVNLGGRTAGTLKPEKVYIGQRCLALREQYTGLENWRLGQRVQRELHTEHELTDVQKAARDTLDLIADRGMRALSKYISEAMTSARNSNST